MLDLGTVKPGSTIRIPFSTFDKDDGSSITMTNFAAADILIYKDGSTTERASTSGYTATTDFDSKTGKQVAVIDLSDNTTSDFYNAGSEYLVAIDSVTVDTVTTGGWVARFRIGYPGATLDTTIASLSSQTSFTLTAGPAEDDALNGMWAIIHDIASSVQAARVLIVDYGSSKTVTLASGATFTAAAGDNISIMGWATLDPSIDGTYDDGAIWVDTNNGTSGTVVGVNGTATNPVSSWADALTLNSSLGLKRFHLLGTSSITLTASVATYQIIGSGLCSVNLGSQIITNAYFENSTITGIAGSGAARFYRCQSASLTISGNCIFENCRLGTLSTSVTNLFLVNCWAYAGALVIDVGATVGDSAFYLHNFHGFVAFSNLGQSGTDIVYLTGSGDVQFNANCTGGTADVIGKWNLTDNSGNITINITDVWAIDDDQLAAVNLRLSLLGMVGGNVEPDTGNTATSFKIDSVLGAKVSNYFGNSNGGLVLAFIDGTTNEWLTRRVTAFSTTSDFITVEEAFPDVPADLDEFILLGRITKI